MFYQIIELESVFGIFDKLLTADDIDGFINAEIHTENLFLYYGIN